MTLVPCDSSSMFSTTSVLKPVLLKSDLVVCIVLYTMEVPVKRFLLVVATTPLH